MERTKEQGLPMGRIKYGIKGMKPHILNSEQGLVCIVDDRNRVRTHGAYNAYTCYWMTEEEVEKFGEIFKNLVDLRELQLKKNDLLFEMVRVKLMELCKD